MTKPGCEAHAIIDLKRSGIEGYSPRISYRVGGRRRLGRLFPRYLFGDIEDEWYMLADARDVIGLVFGAGGKPGTVSDDFINGLKSRENSAGVIAISNERYEGRERFQLEDILRITSGTFSGYKGLYDGLDEEERECILLDLMGRMIRLPMESGMLELEERRRRHSRRKNPTEARRAG